MHNPVPEVLVLKYDRNHASSRHRNDVSVRLLEWDMKPTERQIET